MKLFFLFVGATLLFCPVFADESALPAQQGVVSDYFGIIDDATKEKIEALANDLKKITTINLAVVVVKTTLPDLPKVYGQRLYDKWDVGQEKLGLEHGVLLIFAVLDRQVKIITGRGVDFIMTEQKREELEFNLYPALSQGRYSDGLYYGVAMINHFILNDWQKYEEFKKASGVKNFALTIFSLVVMAVFLTVVFNGTFVAGFATVVGGLGGFLILKYPGLFLGATIGFLLNMARQEYKETATDKELKKITAALKSSRGIEEADKDENENKS